MISPLFLTFIVPLLAWEVYLSKMNNWNFVNDGWTKNDGSTLLAVYTCPLNMMSLICLDQTTQNGQRLITELPPHYQVKVLTDFYYGGHYTDDYGELEIDSIQIFSNFYNIGNNMKQYTNQCGPWGSYNQLEIKTIVSTISHSASSISINISSNLDSPNSDEGFCFRNFQFLINPCHYSCQSCNGGLNNNCLSCYDSTTPVSGRCPTCSNPNLSFQTSLYGCVQECTRANYLADQNKFCQSNNRVSIHSTSFDWALNVVPTIYDWNLFNNGVPQLQSYFTCNGYSFVGMYSGRWDCVGFWKLRCF